MALPQTPSVPPRPAPACRVPPRRRGSLWAPALANRPLDADSRCCQEEGCWIPDGEDALTEKFGSKGVVGRPRRRQLAGTANGSAIPDHRPRNTRAIRAEAASVSHAAELAAGIGVSNPDSRPRSSAARKHNTPSSRFHRSETRDTTARGSVGDRLHSSHPFHRTERGPRPETAADTALPSCQQRPPAGGSHQSHHKAEAKFGKPDRQAYGPARPVAGAVCLEAHREDTATRRAWYDLERWQAHRGGVKRRTRDIERLRHGCSRQELARPANPGTRQAMSPDTEQRIHPRLGDKLHMGTGFNRRRPGEVTRAAAGVR